MKNKSLIIGSSLLGITASASMAFAEVNQPQEIIMRPLTTPGGQITAAGDFGILIAPDPIGTAMGLGLGGFYGVNEQLEVGASYGFSLKEFEAKGDLNVTAAFSILEGNLAVAADAGFGYSLLAEGLEPLTAGAEVRFRLNDQLAVYSPGHQLRIALEGDPKPITLGLPVGVGYQASPQLFAFVATEVANISISNSSTVVFGADYIPLTAGAFFSPSNTMDLGGSIGWFDLKEASDFIVINLSARLHM
jgi:hypothetical protein